MVLDLVESAEFGKDSRGIGGDLQAGADLGELRGLLEDVAAYAVARQGKRGRETRHPGSDDGGGLDRHG
ncbi:hypothetical protein D3C72_1799260 [compost metagenome]